MAIAPLNLANVNEPREAFLPSACIGGVVASIVTIDTARSALSLSTPGRAALGGFVYGGTISAVAVLIHNFVGDFFGATLRGEVVRSFVCIILAVNIGMTITPLLGLTLAEETAQVIGTTIGLISFFRRILR